MPELYDMPTINDSENFYTLSKYINTQADGLVFITLMFVIWIIIFTATKQFSAGKAFAYASTVSAILAIPLGIIALIAPKFMYLFIIMSAIGFVWLKLAEARPTV